MSSLPSDLTGTWQIDPTHSTVGFAVKHAMVSTTRGRFTAFTGGATIDAANPEAATAWLDIEATSVDTGMPQRDGHLQSPDFWDAANNPTITFRSTSAKLDGDELVLTGDLTIRGISRSVEVAWEFGGVATDPFGTTKAGFEGTATIKRSDWDLTWNAALETGGFLVSDKVKLVLEIEANKQVVVPA
jgi:polyisoprenoid-binding protein YceI